MECFKTVFELPVWNEANDEPESFKNTLEVRVPQAEEYAESHLILEMSGSTPVLVSKTVLKRIIMLFDAGE